MSDDFSVNDKRLFTRDGQVNPGVSAEAENSGPNDAAQDRAADEPFWAGGGADLPPANFAGLLIGLATSAFIHLGESPEADQAEGVVDLPAAKHAIDLLAVLQGKTRGNLEPEEDSLLTTLLYDLRLKYVQASRPGK